jgi:hypothetical protein
MNVRTKITINNRIIEQVNSFSYLGYAITVTGNRDLKTKWKRFKQTCNTIRTSNNETRKYTEFRNLDLKKGAKIETAEKEIVEECSRLHREGPNKKY